MVRSWVFFSISGLIHRNWDGWYLTSSFRVTAKSYNSRNHLWNARRCVNHVKKRYPPNKKHDNKTSTIWRCISFWKVGLFNIQLLGKRKVVVDEALSYIFEVQFFLQNFWKPLDKIVSFSVVLCNPFSPAFAVKETTSSWFLDSNLFVHFVPKVRFWMKKWIDELRIIIILPDCLIIYIHNLTFVTNYNWYMMGTVYLQIASHKYSFHHGILDSGRGKPRPNWQPSWRFTVYGSFFLYLKSVKSWGDTRS